MNAVVPENEPITLDLTGPGSHVISIEPGKVSFALGPRDMDGRRLEAIVPLDAAINWAAFDRETVPGGYHWPRAFYYHGDDVGFAVWSRLRPIENFTWRPSKASHLDMTGAQIGHFHVLIAAQPLEIILGGTRVVWLSGDLDLLKVNMAAGAEMPSITFSPAPTGTVCKVPTWLALAELTMVLIEGEAVGMPFDCSSLLQFSGLRILELRGNVTNLAALAELKELRTLVIRSCPDLTGMPELQTWQHLGSFTASDIEARGGKVLRAELNRLKKSGRMIDRSTISQLREPVWFATEYGLPFAEWAGKAARQATRAYKQAAIAVARAISEEDVKSALIAFVEVFNTLPDIGTIEREDVSDAMDRLAALAPAHVTPEMAQGWFDAVRDF
jgi:hypothetical protein